MLKRSEKELAEKKEKRNRAYVAYKKAKRIKCSDEKELIEQKKKEEKLLAEFLDCEKELPPEHRIWQDGYCAKIAG